MDLSLYTKERITEAAIEVFLEKGYEAATVRGICARAGANVAAVSYHFGSKDGLRAAVLQSILERVQQACPIFGGLEADMPAGERLLRLVRNLLAQAYPVDPELTRLSRLFWLEMGNPSLALTPIVEGYMRPIKDQLEGIVRELTGVCDPETVRLCASAVVGQCLFDCQNRAIIAQLYPGEPSVPQDRERMARFVAGYALAGLGSVHPPHGKDL